MKSPFREAYIRTKRRVYSRKSPFVEAVRTLSKTSCSLVLVNSMMPLPLETQTSKKVPDTHGFYNHYLQEDMAVDIKLTVHYWTVSVWNMDWQLASLFALGTGWLTIAFGPITCSDESRLGKRHAIDPGSLLDSLVEQFREQPNGTFLF
jgi:hypothetical protein